MRVDDDRLFKMMLGSSKMMSPCPHGVYLVVLANANVGHTTRHHCTAGVTSTCLPSGEGEGAKSTAVTAWLHSSGVGTTLHPSPQSLASPSAPPPLPCWFQRYTCGACRQEGRHVAGRVGCVEGRVGVWRGGEEG